MGVERVEQEGKPMEVGGRVLPSHPQPGTATCAPLPCPPPARWPLLQRPLATLNLKESHVP
jgi:hypothetical protein